MAGLAPQRRPTLPRSRERGEELAQYAASRILHANRLGQGGVWPTTNPTELEPNQLYACRDMHHFEDSLRVWPGDAAKGSTTGSTEIMGIFSLVIGGAVQDNIFFDQKLCFKWDSGSSDWVITYEVYTKGDIDETNSGSTAVTGNAGTDWATRDTTTGTAISTGEGAEFKLDSDGAGAWTEIATVSGDTALVLSENYNGSTVGPGATEAYTIRKRFTGSTEDFFEFLIYQNKGYFSNGVDHLREYDPDTSPEITAVVDTTTPNNVPSLKAMESYAGRIFGVGVGQYARTTPTNQTMAWCADSDVTDWTGTGSGFRNFIETPGACQTVRRMDENLVLYKEFDIWFGVQTGISSPPVYWEPKITSPRHGCLAYRSVASVAGAGHVYLGRDDFYLLTPFQTKPLGSLAIRDFIFNQISRDVPNRIQAMLLDEYRVVAWLIPLGSSTHATFLFWDYNRDVWYGPVTPGSNRQVYSFGRFNIPTANNPTYGDLVGTYGDQTWKYGGTVVGQGAQSLLYGDDDGDITEVDESHNTFNGETRNPLFQSAAVYTNTPLEESVGARVTLIYRQPAASVAPNVSCSLSDDGFITTLATDTMTLGSANPGAIAKAYFDFTISAERLQAQVTNNGTEAGLEVLELGIEITRAGVEI